MKTYHVLTIFPEMVQAFCSSGVLGQAQKNNLLSVQTHNPRDFTTDNHKTVDDRPFGGGDGMLMLAEPLAKTMASIPQPGWVVYLSPQGQLFTDQKAQELAKRPELTLICGRYAGVDQRFLNEFVDEEISIGDYVLSGGELAACAVIDASARFVSGVLGHEQSAQKDSLTSGHLEAPAFSRPREWNGEKVPEILLSGHHENIEEWKTFVGILLSLQKRPETLQVSLSHKQKQKVLSFLEGISSEEKKILGLESLSISTVKNWLEQNV
jgi:tRNA (guanine37-N1)-methyltransferase